MPIERTVPRKAFDLEHHIGSDFYVIFTFPAGYDISDETFTFVVTEKDTDGDDVVDDNWADSYAMTVSGQEVTLVIAQVVADLIPRDSYDYHVYHENISTGPSVLSFGKVRMID